MAWAKSEQPVASKGQQPTYGADYYKALFEKKRENHAPIRMALVGKENTAKTGLSLDLALKHTDKEIIVLDCDNSAQNTVDLLLSNKVEGADRIRVIPLIDEMDDAMWNADNTTNWLAVVKKLEWFTSYLGEQHENIGAVVMDGGSTFLKWCEFVMTERLIERGVIKDDSDNFNQKEWRERNRVFKGVLNRLTALPITYIFFTFHLKDKKQFMDKRERNLLKVADKIFNQDSTGERYQGERMVVAEGWHRYAYGLYCGAQHNKFLIVDRQVMITGSFNFTDNAAESYLENCVKIWDSSAVEKARTYFNMIRSKYVIKGYHDDQQVATLDGNGNIVTKPRQSQTSLAGSR